MAKSNAPEKLSPADAPAEKVTGKRQRRPSVRFGEIGGYVSSDSNRKVTNKTQNGGKHVKGKESKNVKAKKSEVSETLTGKEGKSKKGLVVKTKRARSSLVNVNVKVDDKAGKDVGDEFHVSDSDSDSDSDSPISDSDDLIIGKLAKSDGFQIGRSKSTKRMRSGKIDVEKDVEGEGEGEGDGDGDEFMVSDSESPETENSVEEETENADTDNGGNDENGDGDAERNGVNGVKVWLDELGLGKYGPVFDVHEVDQEVLPLLTLEDLKEMGVNAVGSRRKMYAAIEKLRE